MGAKERRTMKKLLFILSLAICFSACTKKSTDSTESLISSQEKVSEPSAPSAANETNESNEFDLPVMDEAKTPKIQTVSEELNIYAVNSFEGLRVRSTPSVDGTKIGVLEYQETVACLSRETEKIVLDGISSSWYKVKSLDTGLEGYVFGGYLTPLHSVKYPAADRNRYAVDSEKILSLIDESSGIETDWKLEDGIYLPAQLILQHPNGMNLDREICGVVSNKGKLYFFYSFDGGETIVVNGSSQRTDVGPSYKPEANETENTQTEFVVYINERSGGGECQSVSFNGTNLVITFYANHFGLINRAAYILEKLSSESKSIQTSYSYSFPYFANITGPTPAYSLIANLSEADISITGNQREILYDDWGPLSDEGVRNILELTDYMVIDGAAFYKGIYRGQELYIKQTDISCSLYLSKKLLEEAISFEYGL